MRRRPPFGLAALALIAAGPAALTAQSGTGDGFLFGAPRGALVVRVGFDQPVAGGALFERLGRELTLDRGSYGALNLGADVALRLAPRFDLTLGAGWARSVRSMRAARARSTATSWRATRGCRSRRRRASRACRSPARCAPS
jgi:hypothetical protein